MQVSTYTLPAYWASALINGDYTGINDAEKQELTEWLKKEKPGSCLSCDGDGYFAHSNDANNVGGIVADYSFSV